jgi:hypothetical protein
MIRLASTEGLQLKPFIMLPPDESLPRACRLSQSTALDILENLKVKWLLAVTVKKMSCRWLCVYPSAEEPDTISIRDENLGYGIQDISDSASEDEHFLNFRHRVGYAELLGPRLVSVSPSADWGIDRGGRNAV